MKILFFSHKFGFPTTTFIRNETEAFHKTDSIKYICNSVYSKTNTPEYVDIIPYKENVIIKKIKWWLWKADLVCNFQNKSFSNDLNKSISEFNPDVIHCHFGYESLMLLDNISDFEKRKIIIHFHGYDASAMTRKKSYIKKLKHYLSKPNIYTISCNAFFIDKFKKEFDITLSQSSVVKCGVDTQNVFSIPESNTVQNQRIIIQVSSFAEKKGHVYTLQAFAKVLANPNFSDVKLFLTGDGKRKAELELLVSKLNISNNVVFLGTLTPKEVAQNLSKASVFVHHSITDSTGDMEGIPTSIMEAMAFKLPIVSTIHSGIPELIVDGENGYLVQEKDIDKYALRIMDALNMGKLLINREKIISEYNIEHHNDLLRKIYQDLLH
jgi:colanic acid/amylovoran biosynthesis glycosyltransferase